MITAIHTLVYSDDPPATRAFLRDVLGWPCVNAHPSDNAGSQPDPGWLIFGTGPSELGVHPTDGDWEGDHSVHHEITLMCDDVAATRAELEAKGATFADEISDDGFGLTTMMKVPGAGGMLLYEPRHDVAYTL